ncbi:MAG TPA: hypothetical protein VKE96_34445 [Vicinamibacterales bacterium]|nr:hypothetical protein [Vicinamibacterales bacterium]
MADDRFADNPSVTESDLQTNTLVLLNAKREVLPRENWPSMRAPAGKYVVEEVFLKRPDGVETPFIGTAAPVRDRKGAIIATAASYQEITPLAEFSNSRMTLLQPSAMSCARR